MNPRPNEQAVTEGKISSEVYTQSENAVRAQDVVLDRVSPAMVLKGGQELKWGEKGHSRRGTGTSKGTDVTAGMT